MSVQERTIVNEAEEEAKRNRKKILGLFPVSSSNKKPSSQAGSGTATPNPEGTPRKSSAGNKDGALDDEDDDLPPREADIGDLNHPSMSRESLATEDDPEVRAIPKTAGFDFQAISRELGKDIDVDRLRVTEPAKMDLQRQESLQPPERSGSAPPMSATSPSFTRSSHTRSSVAFATDDDDDDVGDIAGSTRQLSLNFQGSNSALDIPSWDRPVSTSPSPSGLASISPPITESTLKAPTFSFNAWSSSDLPRPALTTSTSHSMPTRAAPPARPHPPEFMANPFASGDAENNTGSNGISRSWGKKVDDQWAEKNPW